MDVEDSCRKERIETDDKRIDIVVKDDDVLIEVKRGTVFTGNSWIRLDWETWNKVNTIVRRLKSNTNMKIIKEKKISGFLNSDEEIIVRILDGLIEIEEAAIRKSGGRTRLGHVYLYREEWEEVKKCVDELLKDKNL